MAMDPPPRYSAALTTGPPPQNSLPSIQPQIQIQQQQQQQSNPTPTTQTQSMTPTRSSDATQDGNVSPISTHSNARALPHGASPSPPAQTGLSSPPSAPRAVQYETPKLKGLEYRRAKPLFCAFFIIATTTLSWILLYTAHQKSRASMAHPITAGKQAQVEKMIRAAWILHTVGALVALPSIGTILSTGAVQLTIVRKGKGDRRGHRLNLRQVFALADSSWMTRKLSNGSGGRVGIFTKVALCLCFLGIFTPFLIPVLVKDGMKPVLFCDHGGPWTPFCVENLGYLRIPSMIARTTSLAYLSGYSNTIDVVVRTLEAPWASNLVRGSRRDPLVVNATDMDLWVSAVRQEVVTGFVRQATIRTDSKSSCEAVDMSAWPSDCAGYNSSDVDSTQGFFRQFAVAGVTGTVCAPPDASKSWKELGTLQYQEAETVYIGMEIRADIEGKLAGSPWGVNGFMAANFSWKCTGMASSGFYEVPNVQTRWSDGPVFTSAEQVEKDIFVPLIAIWSSFNNIGLYSPFRLAILSLFGQRSYLQTLLSTDFNTVITTIKPGPLCDHSPLHGAISGGSIAQPTDIGAGAFLMYRACVQNLNLSFSGTSISDVAMGSLAHASSIRLFFGGLSKDQQAGAILKMAIDAAFVGIHEADKPDAVIANQVPLIGGDGHVMLTVDISKGCIIVMWLFTALELVALIVAVGWAVSEKTWTAKLDALAVARITAEVGRSGATIPGTGPLNRGEVRALDDVDGMVEDADAIEETSGENSMRETEEGIELQTSGGQRQQEPLPAVLDPVSPVSPIEQPGPLPQIQIPQAPSQPHFIPLPMHILMSMSNAPTAWTPEAAAEAALVMDGPPMGPNNREIPEELTRVSGIIGHQGGNDGSEPPSYASLANGGRPSMPITTTAEPVSLRHRPAGLHLGGVREVNEGDEEIVSPSAVTGGTGTTERSGNGGLSPFSQGGSMETMSTVGAEGLISNGNRRSREGGRERYRDDLYSFPVETEGILGAPGDRLAR